MSYEPKRADFSHARPHQSLLRHPDKAVARHEGSDDGRRNGRRAGRLGPHGMGAVRPDRGAAGQGGGDVHAVGHDVQSGRDRHALPARRRNSGARGCAHPVQRGRRSGRHQRRDDPRPAGRSGHFQRRDVACRDPSDKSATRRRSGWWRWSRPRTKAAAPAGGRRNCTRWPRLRKSTACRFTWTARGC